MRASGKPMRKAVRQAKSRSEESGVRPRPDMTPTLYRCAGWRGSLLDLPGSMWGIRNLRYTIAKFEPLRGPAPAQYTEIVFARGQAYRGIRRAGRRNGVDRQRGSCDARYSRIRRACDEQIAATR